MHHTKTSVCTTPCVGVQTRKINSAEILESLTKSDLAQFVEEKITNRRSVCIAMISESRYKAEIENLRDSSNDLGLTLVHIDDAGAREKWRSEQKEHIALPDPVVHAVQGE